MAVRCQEWPINRYVPQIAGQAVVSDVLANGNKYYRPPPGDAFMPIEFGAACYRFGQSQVRPSCRANFTSGTGDSTNPAADPFFGLVFDATEPEFNGPINYDRDDLLGGYPAPNRYIGWQTFFDLGDGQVKNNKKIDTTISSVMFTLPVPAIAPHTQTSPTELPQRNLLRQLTWSLPAGQSIAAAIGVTPLSAADLADIGSVYAPFATSTPLWYYMLAEAKLTTDGLNLGPVGSRIVTEHRFGLLLPNYAYSRWRGQARPRSHDLAAAQGSAILSAVGSRAIAAPATALQADHGGRLAR